MKRLLVNLVAFFVIGIGGFYLSTPVLASSNAAMSCSSGYVLECATDGQNYICCTVCQDDGRIGDCDTTPVPRKT